MVHAWNPCIWEVYIQKVRKSQGQSQPQLHSESWVRLSCRRPYLKHKKQEQYHQQGGPGSRLYSLLLGKLGEKDLVWATEQVQGQPLNLTRLCLKRKSLFFFF